MRSFSWHSRVLPLTMVAIALLFADKAVGLVRDATAEGASQPPAVAALAGPVPAGQPAQSSMPATSNAPPLPSVPDVAPVTPAELQLLQDLRKRRGALDDREHQMDQRNELLQSAELKLQSRLDELTALQQRLEQLDDQRRKRGSANWSGLVKMYEDMKPRDAATIFNVLDVSVLLEVLDRMDERKAAFILAGMLPERARLATQMLAQKRTRQDVVAPAITPDPPG
ncbi:MAG: MotE family protein [Janthinobacterium lividum]